MVSQQYVVIICFAFVNLFLWIFIIGVSTKLMFILIIGVRGFGGINIHMLKYKWKKKGKFKQPS